MEDIRVLNEEELENVNGGAGTDKFTMRGYVTECLPNEHYKVKIEKTTVEVTAYLSGKFRREGSSKPISGTKVAVEFQSLDMHDGRIVQIYG